MWDLISSSFDRSLDKLTFQSKLFEHLQPENNLGYVNGAAIKLIKYFMDNKSIYEKLKLNSILI